MSFDPAIEFKIAQNAFLKERGGLQPAYLKKPGSVHSFFKLGEMVPATTWGDVLLFSQSFIRATDPTPGGCTGWLTTTLFPTLNVFCFPASDFVHTPIFNVAKADWLRWFPMQKERNYATLTGNMLDDIMYPYNEQFWGYGYLYALARSGAGMVDSKWSMAAKSLKEAVSELPAMLRDAADVVIPTIPNPTKWVELIKWTSIAGGLGMLWYVLRPKKS